MAITLSTIILFVHNLERLKQFYTNHFHLTVKEEIPGEWVLLHAGSCDLGLHKASHGPGNTLAETNSKLVFDIEEDLDKLRDQLLSEHVDMKEIKQWAGYPYRMCDGTDPEGNVFQLRES